ncbi:MAG: phenylacetate--CoA ligase family protein [Patescibacteria group bacterium]
MESRFEKMLHGLGRPVFLADFLGEGDFVDSMPASRLVEYQDRALRAIVARAYEKSPFYRRKMDDAGVTPQAIECLADLERLPFTAKDELRGNPWALLACPREDVALIQVSTGTTGGEEIYVMYTWRDYYLHDLAPGYPALVPVERGDVCLVALPYEMSSAGLAFHKTFIEGCGAAVIPAGKGGAYSTPQKTVKLMRDLRPTVAITTPSWAVTLAEAAAEASFPLAGLPLHRMWLTGEGCSSAFRERVAALWGVTANFYYGSLECGCIGIECDAHRGYHVTSGHAIVEIVDERTGAVLAPGEIGEIVVTCLLRHDTPLLRYRTQDLGYLEPDACPCGVTLPRLQLRGRRGDQFVVRGVAFSPFYLEEFLMRLPQVGNWYQFVTGPGGSERLKIRCELAAGVNPSPALADELGSRMEYGTGVPCTFEFVDRLPRPRGKTVRVCREHAPAGDVEERE